MLGWTPLERGGFGCVANRGTVARKKVASHVPYGADEGSDFDGEKASGKTVQLDAPGLVEHYWIANLTLTRASAVPAPW